ncbi:flippase-like domain-containing protein [Methanonatronarchaeum sp. AMET-Sl]|uniref:lysylphosphatidylglycerol synthase transmembrane domain-containing protein n=1 Tax=Methanonatronarchaeum sp. AMET-Sl TaxID=3037654 RepID=UPI00244E0CA2|nr:flippase-like domain-containing protein [Methanonatronarchaeum sp. AMET-Sl]WGI17618.1 flippase-like domain-containing protein [Methanonatronarchaeum sp. AMET-Sl]
MNRLKKFFVISVSVSVVTLALILLLMEGEDLLISLGAVDPVFLVLAIGVHVLGWMFWAGRIDIFSRASDIKLGFKKSLGIVVSSTFLASITPSYAGGEPLRVYLIGKEKGYAGRASAIVFAERALDFVFIVLFALVGMFYLREQFGEIANLEIAFTMAGVLIGLAVLGIVLGFFKPHLIKGFFGYFERPIESFREGTMEQIYREIDSFHRILWMFLREKRIYLAGAFLATALLWSLHFSIPYILFVGMGSEVDFLTVWFGYFLVLLFLFIPLAPGGSGLAEVGGFVVYSALTGAASIGVLVLLWRVSTHYVNLVVGGLLIGKVIKDVSIVEEKIDESVDKDVEKQAVEEIK